MISKTISCIVRGTQTLFAIVIISLVGNIISNSGYNLIKPIDSSSSANEPSGGNPAEINYAMFLGVWTLLSMGLFIPLTLKPRKEEEYLIAMTALDGLTALFYMCDGIALAAAMGIHRCANQDYILQNRITNNSLDPSMRCREAQAATAFIWFNFLIFVATAVFSARALYRFSNPKDDFADARNSEEMDTGGPPVADIPQQAAAGGEIPRFWGHRAAPSTGGLEVTDVRIEDGHWGMASTVGSEGPEVTDGHALHGYRI